MATEEAITVPAESSRTTRAPTAAAPVTVRVHPLDWLRVLALLGVFVYHSMRPFDTDDWHVKNVDRSGIVTVILALMAWGLPLFFLLAGAGSGLAMRTRSAAGYVRERLLRLAVPLAVAYVTLSPLQAFIQETQAGRYHDSLVAAVPAFFGAEWENLRNGPELPLVLAWSGHLWFLIFLLWFSLLGLPLLVLLRRDAGRRMVGWLGEHSRRRGAILLWAVPLAVVHAALPAPGSVEHGWGQFVVFFDVFLAGAVLLADPRLIVAVRRDLFPALYVALAATATFGLAVASGLYDRWSDGPTWTATSVLVYPLLSVWAWAWMMFALALGLRAARFGRPLPRPVGAAAMPFFLVHQPVILAVAYVVVQWHAGIAVKLPAVLGISLILSAALAFGLSRLPYVSTLLGVKRVPARAGSARPAVAGRPTGGGAG
jgi:peptidoglycan/LPS O-acetylase OafA/YrhL